VLLTPARDYGLKLRGLSRDDYRDGRWLEGTPDGYLSRDLFAVDALAQ